MEKSLAENEWMVPRHRAVDDDGAPRPRAADRSSADRRKIEVQ
jgi:hypothetical protein